MNPEQNINQELEEAYQAFASKLFAFADNGIGIDLFNFDEVIKEVMEAVEALGTAKVLSGKQKSSIAQEFATRVIKDLYARKKITESFYQHSIDAMQYVGPAIFTIVSMASQGKVLINQVTDFAEAAGCETKKCCNVL